MFVCDLLCGHSPILPTLLESLLLQYYLISPIHCVLLIVPVCLVVIFWWYWYCILIPSFPSHFFLPERLWLELSRHHHICFSFSVRFSNNNDTRYALGETLFTAYKQIMFWLLLLFYLYLAFISIFRTGSWLIPCWLFIYLVDCRSSPLILWACHSFRLTLLEDPIIFFSNSITVVSLEG